MGQLKTYYLDTCVWNLLAGQGNHGLSAGEVHRVLADLVKRRKIRIATSDSVICEAALSVKRNRARADALSGLLCRLADSRIFVPREEFFIRELRCVLNKEQRFRPYLQRGSLRNLRHEPLTPDEMWEMLEASGDDRKRTEDREREYDQDFRACLDKYRTDRSTQPAASLKDWVDVWLKTEIPLLLKRHGQRVRKKQVCRIMSGAKALRAFWTYFIASCLERDERVRKYRFSDQGDCFHYAYAAYANYLVTEDKRMVSTIQRVRSQECASRHLKVLTAEQFQERVGQFA